MSSSYAALTFAHTGPTTDLAREPRRPLWRQTESEKHLRPQALFVIIQNSVSVAVFKTDYGQVGSGAVMEGLAA